jgi:hypothetical protein
MLTNGYIYVIFIFSLIIPLLLREFRENRTLYIVAILAIGVRYILVFSSEYISLPGITETDAKMFHTWAIELTETGNYYLGIGSDFYINMLGRAYDLFGPSRLLGAEINILAFVISMMFFVKLIKMIGQAEYQIPLLIIFSLLPTMIMITSITLRESWQLLTFIAAVYWGFRYRSESKLIYFLLMVIFSFAMALFHKALIFMAIFLVLTIVLWPGRLQMKSEHQWAKTGAIIIAIISAVAVGFLVVANSLGGGYGGEVITAVVKGNILEYISQYHGILDKYNARASFDVGLDASSWGALMVSWIKVYFYYLFSPFPWQVQNLLDGYAFVEAFTRLLLIVASIYTGIRGNSQYKYYIFQLLFIYFMMTALWSLGTGNYGQAIRHHLLTNWILLLTGGPLVLGYIMRNILRIRQQETLIN